MTESGLQPNSKHVHIVLVEDWEAVYVDDKLVYWHDSLPFSEALYRFNEWGINGVHITHSWEELDLESIGLTDDIPSSLAELRTLQTIKGLGQNEDEDWL